MRLVIICIGALAFSGWFLYDGSISYPAQIELYKEYLDITSDVKEKDKPATWARHAQEQGYAEVVEPRERGDHDVSTQFIYAGVTGVIGLFCLVQLLRWGSRYVAADESGLTSSGNVSVPWDAVKTIDASRWQRKGIAKIHYDTGNGEQVLLIDDWKYDRTASDAIFELVKEHVTEDKFQGLAEAEESDDDDESQDAEFSA